MQNPAIVKFGRQYLNLAAIIMAEEFETLNHESGKNELVIHVTIPGGSGYGQSRLEFYGDEAILLRKVLWDIGTQNIQRYQVI